MKRSFRFITLSLLAALLITSLCACTTSPSFYTEFELSEDELTLTNGEKTYAAYSAKDFGGKWQTGLFATYYYNYSIESPKTGNYASVSSPISTRDVLALEIYDSMTGEYLGMQMYVTEAGAEYIKDIEDPRLDTKAIAYDNETATYGKLTNSMVGMISGLILECDTRISDNRLRDLSSKDSISIYDTELDGFLYAPIGTFYFDRTQVFFVCPVSDGNEAFYAATTLTDAKKDAFMNYIEENVKEYPKDNEFEFAIIPEGNNEGLMAVAKALLISMSVFLGLIMPLIPIALALYLLKKRAWHFKVTDYILLSASGVWLISGIVIFVILLF